MRLLPVLAVVGSLVSWSSSSFAEPGPKVGQEWVVVAKDRHVYVGRFVETTAQGHVAIRLPSGEVRRFQASDIARQGPGGRTDPSPAVIPVGTGPAAFRGPGGVVVHIRGDGTLYRGAAGGWKPVCPLPCSTTVDPAAEYKVGGDSYVDSAPFKVSGSQPVGLVSNGFHRENGGASRVVGSALVMGGVPVLIFGLLGLVGAMPQSPDPNSAYNTTPPPDTHAVGGALAISGAIATAVGVVLVLLPTGRTTVTTTSGRSVAKQSTGPRFSPKGIEF